VVQELSTLEELALHAHHTPEPNWETQDVPLTCVEPDKSSPGKEDAHHAPVDTQIGMEEVAW